MKASDPVVDELRPYFSSSVNRAIDAMDGDRWSPRQLVIELASIHPTYAGGRLEKIAHAGYGDEQTAMPSSELLQRILRNHDLRGMQEVKDVVHTRSTLIDLAAIDPRSAGRMLDDDLLDELRREIDREHRRADGPSGFELDPGVVLSASVTEMVRTLQVLAVRDGAAEPLHLVQSLALVHGGDNELTALVAAFDEDPAPPWWPELKEIGSSRIEPPPGTIVCHPPLLLDPDVDRSAKSVLTAAGHLALRHNAADVDADGRVFVRVRDVFGALITAKEPAIDKLLDELLWSQGVPRDLIRGSIRSYLGDPELDYREFLATVRDDGERPPDDEPPPDEPGGGGLGAEGGTALGPGEPFAGFHHDDTRDRDLLAEDRLGIKPYVRAFALLMASKDLQPPLATGLFGDWGSGKTYFMRALRQEIDRITKQARDSGHGQRELPVYRNVVQIEFNAWHYVDADLWASLADYIFTNLRIVEDEPAHAVQTRREKYVEELKEKGAALRQIETERRQLEERVAVAEQDLEWVRTKRAREVGVLDTVRAVVTADDETKERAGRLLRQSGLPEAGEKATDLQGALSEAKEVARRGSDTVNVLAGRYGTRWLLVALATLLVGPAILAWTGALDWSGVQRAAATAGAFLAGAAAFVRSASAAGRRTLAAIDDVNAQLEKQIDESKIVDDQKKKVTELEGELTKARNQEIALRDRLAQINEALHELAPERRLADFIVSRRDSEDYRKHLGLASVIRRDFDELTKLIKEYNTKLTKDQETSPNEGAKDERADESYKINRIVLYIDDLDRCPPQTVVQVLQAVHLLLAFPLFVVVVGVDSRWLSRSLEKYYGSLLGAGTDADPVAEDDGAPSASPHDYLEKIFQIPFWLRPMNTTAQDALLTSLTTVKADGTALEEDSPEVDEPEPEPAGSEVDAPEPEPSPEPEPAPAESAEPESEAESAVAESAVAEPAESATGTTTSEPTSPAAEPEPAPEVPPAPYDVRLTPIEITGPERVYMSGLRPLLGRSPRSLTRFVNVYRLVRAVEQGSRVRDPSAEMDDDERTLMLLLAIVTGLPQISLVIFRAMAGSTPETLRKMTDREKSSGDAVEQLQWQRLDGWLRENPAIADVDVTTWREQASKVARYSYRIDQL